MISPLKWVERVGVSGRLLAFFKAVGVYFAVGGEAGGRAPSPAAAAAKCAPVLCLLLIVLAHRAETPAHLKERRRYSLLVASGLALGALGDGLLVWPQHFVAGMAAFGAGHVLYMAAFGWRPARPGLAAGLLAATAAYLAVVQAPGVLRLLVPPYALLLAGAAWRGAARGGAAAAGATLFLLSDAALGYTMFAHPLPHQEVLVMSTYYLGQLGVALSALKPPPAPAPAPAPAH